MNIPASFEPLVVSYVEAMKVHGRSPRTVASYLGSLSVFLAYLERAGIADIREVTRTVFRSYQFWLQEQEYTGWTILLRLQAVRRFFEHLARRQLILVNPCEAQEPIRVAYRLPKAVLSVQEAKQVLEAPDATSSVGLRDKAILEMFYSSGVRLEEMTQLTLADVDTKGGFVRIKRGKCAKDRVVPLGQTAVGWLLRYVEQVRSRWSPPEANQPALWLSSRRPYGPLKSQAIEVMVKHYGQRAGMAVHVTPHVWRHTCATHLVAGGANIAYVQRLLGHASLRTTQVYVRTSIPEIKATLAQAHPRSRTGMI